MEGFISGDLNVIYVDELIYDQRPARYRFTLAHEIGHDVFPIKQFTGSESAPRKVSIFNYAPCYPVNEEIGMTLLICLVYCDTHGGRGRRYFSYCRNTFFS